MPDATLEQLFGVALVVPAAISRNACTRARVALERSKERNGPPNWRRYTRIDRASYDVIDEPRLLLEREIIDLAERVTSRKGLAICDWRALRLIAGDYILADHDRLLDDNPIEVVVDISSAPPAFPAEIHYRRRGQVFLRIPAVPGTCSVVERGPTITRNHTYVSKRDPNARVIRIVALLK
jgi:hypothetical protein